MVGFKGGIYMNSGGFFELARNSFRSGLAELSARWGWYLALGIFLTVLGVFAASGAVATTMLSVVLLGWVLLVAGAGLVILSFLTGRWSGFLVSMAAGLLSIAAGIEILSYPVSGASAITMLIGTVLLVAGVFRAVAAVTMRFPQWGWALVSGIVGVVLGGMLLRDWQNTALWFLGFAIGIDLILHGISWMTFSIAIHRLARGLGITEADRPAA